MAMVPLCCSQQVRWCAGSCDEGCQQSTSSGRWLRICERAVTKRARASSAPGRKTAARWQFWNAGITPWCRSIAPRIAPLAITRSRLPVAAIDADINQHLAEALAAAGDPPSLGGHLAGIKEYLRGDNPRISSAAAMVKTTPPGRGSRLLRPGGSDPVHRLAVDTPCGARLVAAGPFSDGDLGVACHHSKTGAVELCLNHRIDGPGEYVVVDCTAGAESFASCMFTRSTSRS